MNRRPLVMLALFTVGVIAVACALERTPQREIEPVFRSPEQTATVEAGFPEVVILEDTTDGTHQNMLLSDDGGLTWTTIDCGNYFRPTMTGAIFIWHNAIYWIDSSDDGIKRYDGIVCSEVQAIGDVAVYTAAWWATSSDNSTLAVMLTDDDTSDVEIWASDNGADWTKELILGDDADCNSGSVTAGGMNRDGTTIYAFGIDCKNYTDGGDQIIKHGVWTSSDGHNWGSVSLSGDFVDGADYMSAEAFAYISGAYEVAGKDDIAVPSGFYCRIKSSGTWTANSNSWSTEVSTVSSQCDGYPIVQPAPNYGSLYSLLDDYLYRSTGGAWSSVLTAPIWDVRAKDAATTTLYAVDWNSSTKLYSSTNSGASWAVVTSAPQYAGLGVGNFASPTATVLATNTPTPVDTATPAAWISEVLRSVATPGCINWNQRGGCGNDDQFVEVAAPSGQALGGWRIAIEDGVGIEVCSYTVATDNLTLPLKAFWQDYMTPVSAGTPTATPTGTLTPAPSTCGQWPSDGEAVLYDSSGVERDRRPYFNATPNASWASQHWATPVATWEYQTPSPGRAWPTATP